MTDQLGLGLTEKPKLVTHQISKWLHVIKQGVLRDGESCGSQITSERVVQLLPLVLCLSYHNDWHLTQKERTNELGFICCDCRPEEYVTALSHLRWLEVCRESMVRQMNESDFTKLQRTKLKWPSAVKHAVRAVEKLVEWLYENKEWMK